MIGKIRLYKALGLKQDNTMYFSTAEEQQSFFDNPQLITYKFNDDKSVVFLSDDTPVALVKDNQFSLNGKGYKIDTHNNQILTLNGNKVSDIVNNEFHIASYTYTDYDNVSYNGARAFKININYVSFMFLEYDYLRFEFPNDDGSIRTIYAFINNISYVSDTCCAIDSTIDLIQTFMFEIQNSYKYGVVKNYTLKQDDFTSYIPYANKYPVSYYDINRDFELTCFKEEGLINCGWVLVSIDPAFDTENNFVHYCYDNGLRIPFIKLAIPIVLSYAIDDNITFQIPDGSGGQTKIIKYSLFVNTDFYKKISPYILDVSICTTQIADEYFSSSSLSGRINLTFSDTIEKHFEQKPVPTYSSEISEYLVLQVISNSVVEYKYKIPENLINNFNLARLPYTYLKIGNAFSSIDINLLDFVNSTPLIKLDDYLHIELLTSLTFPTQVSLRLNLFDGNEFIPINTPLIVGASENIIYSTTAWSNYVSQNRQYASMGLATQQNYERKAFDRQINYEQRKNFFDTISGVAGGLGQFGLGFTQAFATMGASGLSNMASGFGKIVSSGTNAYTTMLGINTKQDIFSIEQRKDRAMQTIQFNDIKTSPSDYDNLTSPVTARFKSVYYPLSIYVYTARNLDDIKKYHEMFGYEVNKPLSNFNLTSVFFKNHKYYDYVSFVSLFIHANIPRDMEETIEQILTNGIRFWYDYTKFLDYSVVNEEL